MAASVALSVSSNAYSAGPEDITKYISAQQPAVEQGEKAWGAEEAAITKNIRAKFAEMLIQSTGDSTHMKRDAHPKAHGCVAGELTIDNSKLPENFRVGLFAANTTYNTTSRFSNGNPDHTTSDVKKDFRGFTVKIKDVSYSNYLQDIKMEEGANVHDLVFMNDNAFFIPNTEKYNDFMNMGLPKYLLSNPRTALRLFRGMKRSSSPLQETYHSATPYKLGATSMKMQFKPCSSQKIKRSKEAGDNFLGEVLEKSLAAGEQCFNFFVQPNKNSKKNKLENAMVRWSERKSPLIKVGQLILPQQTGFRSAAAMETCENMTFNPWRAPQANRPMGGVNRVRLEVYLNQAQMRRVYNKVD